jgi:hypothetical protein
MYKIDDKVIYKPIYDNEKEIPGTIVGIYPVKAAGSTSIRMRGDDDPDPKIY